MRNAFLESRSTWRTRRALTAWGGSINHFRCFGPTLLTRKNTVLWILTFKSGLRIFQFRLTCEGWLEFHRMLCPKGPGTYPSDKLFPHHSGLLSHPKWPIFKLAIYWILNQGHNWKYKMTLCLVGIRYVFHPSSLQGLGGAGSWSQVLWSLKCEIEGVL